MDRITGWNAGAMVVGLALVAMALATGCKTDVEFACNEETPCLPRYPDRPFCDLQGIHPGSDGIKGTCVANPFDAGLPDGMIGSPDGSVADASMSAPDAVSYDADPGAPDADMTPDANMTPDADVTPDATPPLVVTQLALGDEHTCALISNGDVRCWGDGAFGQLGYGNTNDIGDNEPASAGGVVSLGAPAIAIAAGSFHTCALLMGGTVRCWGFNNSGELGYGHTNRIGDNEAPSSQNVLDLNGSANTITAGGGQHNCVRQGTSVRCWGVAAEGQLGYGNQSPVGDNEAPGTLGAVQVGGNVSQITAGRLHTCALLTNGDVRCWGAGAYGRLGNGNQNTIGDGELPTADGPVSVGGSVSAIHAGSQHTCVRLGTSVKCWGRANFGQLGYGNVTDIGDNESPSTVGTVNLGISVEQLSVGANHNCVQGGGAVRCWGAGGFGRLGYGNTNAIGDTELPFSAGDVQVGSTVTHVEAGSTHTCVITTAGKVRCWGNGANGKLGYGGTDDIGDNETPASAGDVPLLP